MKANHVTTNKSATQKFIPSMLHIIHQLLSHAQISVTTIFSTAFSKVKGRISHSHKQKIQVPVTIYKWQAPEWF